METTTKNESTKDVNPTARPRSVPVGSRRDLQQQTNIAVEQLGETVQTIRVSCRCGEVTTIHCAYPDQAEKS